MPMAKEKVPKWSLLSMQAAVRDVIIYTRSKNDPVKKQSTTRNIRRHVKKARCGEGVVKCIGRKPILSKDQEDELYSTWNRNCSV